MLRYDDDDGRAHGRGQRHLRTGYLACLQYLTATVRCVPCLDVCRYESSCRAKNQKLASTGAAQQALDVLKSEESQAAAINSL